MTFAAAPMVDADSIGVGALVFVALYGGGVSTACAGRDGEVLIVVGTLLQEHRPLVAAVAWLNCMRAFSSNRRSVKSPSRNTMAPGISGMSSEKCTTP